jgi:DDE superfamily endonuclease
MEIANQGLSCGNTSNRLGQLDNATGGSGFDMNVPDFALPVLTMLRPTFPMPTSNRFLVLPLGTLRTAGRRTITHILRTVRHQAPGHPSSYHRVWSQRRWSPWVLARAVIRFVRDHVVPSGPVLLAGDGPVTEHPGPQAFGQGRQRDGVRPSHNYTADRWGHQWGVLSILVKLPCATRPRALPVLVALSRPPAWDRVPGTRHNTPAHRARLLLGRLMRWLPGRHLIFVADSG